MTKEVLNAGRWNKERVTSEAKGFLQEHGKFNFKLLREMGRYDLVRATRRHYSGGITQLVVDLGQTPLRKRSYWTPETIKIEAEQFLEATGSERITQGILAKNRRADLSMAISTRYPGGIQQLKKDISLPQERKPRAFWQPEVVEQQAREFLEQNGVLTYEGLNTKGKGDLSGAINRSYPGGMRALKNKLAIPLKREAGYWTPEKVLEEARRIYEEIGQLSHTALKGRYSSFGWVISQFYPGGITVLRRELGLAEGRKPNNYWNVETIEAEFSAFCEENSGFNYALLRKQRQGLVNAIRNYYPGGLIALKNKFGIAINRKDLLQTATISPEEANEQLRRLLEV